MLPTGMAFTGVSAKAIAACAAAKLPRVYWDWRRLLGGASQGYWNGTVPVHFFFGLQEALRMLEEEGLDNVFARITASPRRPAGRCAAGARMTGRSSLRPIPGAIRHRHRRADARGLRCRQIAPDRARRFNLSLGGGLGPLKGRLFRIGHLGDLNEPMVLGAIATIEMALDLAHIPHGRGGAQAAADYLVNEA